jgi:methylglutaconyl-CoA hydratase
MSGTVRSERVGWALTLTLDRPEKRNALNLSIIEALHAGLEEAALDAGVRVVVLRGAGKDFCAGADLAELHASIGRPLAHNEADALRLGELFLRIRALEKPVVAVVQGRALAGGCGLATACDLVLAAASSQFGYPEVERGFVPAMVLSLLRRQVSERTAFDLITMARVLDAAEAVRLGLVSRVVPDANLEAEAEAVVARLAGSSPTALALTKRTLYELDGLTFDEGIRLGARVNALARSSEDFRAAVERFLS